MESIITSIHQLIEWGHKPFAKIIPLQTFRYGITGSFNTVLDIVLYFVGYNYIFDKQDFEMLGFTISPHIAAFLFSFCITFITGFLLNKTIAFNNSSTLRKRIQLFRYMVIVSICIVLNYVFLRLFVEKFGFYPTPSKVLTTGIVVIFSYFSQKHYTFKSEKI